jgi:archaellum component FlaF (FlaF/FlaG flagellin family)
MTKELEPLMNSETIDWGAVKEVLKKHANIAYDLKDAEGRASYRLLNEQTDMLNNGMFPTHPKATNLLVPGRGYTPLQKAVLETAEPTAKELKSATRKMLIDKGIEKFSNPAANLVVTVPGGRGKGKVNTVETPEEREEIEVIKKREAPFWDMKFKPRKDNSLMYKAWKEYADEHGWEVED